jgi:hypothetical protein
MTTTPYWRMSDTATHNGAKWGLLAGLVTDEKTDRFALKGFANV